MVIGAFLSTGRYGFIFAWVGLAGLAEIRQWRRGALLTLDSADGQSWSVAASSIIMASRFLASSNGRLVISVILRSR